MKKNICFKVTSFPEISETFVVNSIIQAIQAGYEMNVITDALNPISHSSQTALLKKYKLLNKTIHFKQPTNKKKRIKATLMLCMNPVLLFFLIKYFLACKKLSLDYVFYLNFYKKYSKLDTFHVHFAPAIKPLLTLKKIGFLKSKIIVTFHGYDAHFSPKGKVLKRLVSNYEKHVNHITVNSSYLKQVLVDKGFSKDLIAVVPVGIDVVFFNSKIKKHFNQESGLKLITIGRLTPLKGQQFGIQTVKQLIDKGIKIHYTIVGEGVDFLKLKELVKNLKLEHYITFTGAKNQEEIKSLLEVHDVFLMTSTYDKTKRREAFGVVSLEAQCMGLPVIAFNSGGVVDTVLENQTGFIVKDRDVHAMAEKIEILYNSLKLLNEMSANATAHVVSKFDLKHTNKGYLDLY